MKKIFVRFVAEQSGVTAIECGLIAGLIAVAIISAVTTLGQNISAREADQWKLVDLLFARISNGQEGCGSDLDVAAHQLFHGSPCNRSCHSDISSDGLCPGQIRR